MAVEKPNLPRGYALCWAALPFNSPEADYDE